MPWGLVLKIVGPLAILLGAYLWYQGQMDAAYNRGVNDTTTEWVKKVDKERQKNEELSTKLNDQAIAFGVRVADIAAAREARETHSENTIREIVKNNPVYQKCEVDQEVLDLRNKIRSEFGK